MAAESLCVHRLVTIMGPESASMFLFGWGGLSVYIPKQPVDSWIETLGEAGAEQLCKHYGGENISVPNDYIQPKKLAAQIVELLQRGYSHNEVAFELGCTWRYSALIAQEQRIGNRGFAKLKRSKNDGVHRLPDCLMVANGVGAGSGGAA